MCRLQAGTGVHADDRHIHPHRFIVGLSALQAGLILLYCLIEIPGIDLSNQSPGLHILILLHVHPDNLPGHASTDLDQVAIHLCIVGVFVIRRVPPEEQRAHNQNSDHADDDEPPPPLLAGRTVEILLVIVAGLGTLFFHGSCTA
jgi:hypothetical protein